MNTVTLAVATSLTCAVAAIGAEAPAASVLAVDGNTVTIVDAAGRKKNLELVDTKGLARGVKVSWCEDDCRELRTPDSSIQVRRVLDTRP